MERPIVSVIIPVYNTLSTLSRCIDSVLSQSLDDMEVVLVDDGSPDDAGAVCDDYAARHDCVTVVHQSNAGLAEARRAGLRAARGEYVVHVDSDDTIPAGALATLYHHITAHQLDMAYGCYDRIVGSGRRIINHVMSGVFTGDDFLRHLLDPRCICALWGSISRRELWSDDIYPPADLRLPSEDTFMLIHLTAHLERVGLFNDVVYNYYYNPSSLSIAGPLHRQELWREYFSLIRENLRGRGVLEQHESALRGMEIDRLGFQCNCIDQTDSWYKQVLSYPTAGLRTKTRVLHLLLRWPLLLRWCVSTNRRLRYSMGKRP